MKVWGTKGAEKQAIYVRHSDIGGKQTQGGRSIKLINIKRVLRVSYYFICPLVTNANHKYTMQRAAYN